MEILKMYIKRDLEDKIRHYLESPEIIIVLGPRQSGKSTLLQNILKDLSNANFLDFEDVDILSQFESDVKTFASLYVETFRYVLMDEIQYAQNFGKNMKFLFDTYKDKVKFIVTGSSATDFYLKGLKYLVGRAFIFHLYPFSFREFLAFKNNRLISLVQKSALQPELSKLIEEFVVFGGYPRVVLAETGDEKKIILKNIYNLLVQREIAGLTKLMDQQKIISLVRLLALNTANLINYSHLARQSSLKFAELKGLLSLLEKTFVVNLLPPFFTNKRLEIVKNPKVFFIDTGLRNAVINNFSILRTDIGALYESFVFGELLKQDLKINFWRSKSKAEVDFVIEYEGEYVPIEVKYGQSKITRSFRSFIEHYHPRVGFVFNNQINNQTVINNTVIYQKYFSEIIHLKTLLQK